MSAPGSVLSLFEGYGIEIEYMIVDRDSLDVRPFSDRVLAAVAGEIVSDVECGELAWSNELVMHVIEIKTNGPAPRLEGLGALFQRDVRRIDELLAAHGARLLPTGMHPWMDPDRESVRWPHEYSAVYERFHAIFDCRGHGWSNLQSMHLNLPFAGDEEFARLHAAIRLVLPVLPALAASSPVFGGTATGFQDNRMRVYRTNARAVPSVSGQVVPEPVWTRAQYEALLESIYADLAPFDPEGILRHEWVNARGAIARFDRSAIEIRVLDVQECPEVDLALAALVTDVLRALVAERWVAHDAQRGWDTTRLARLLWASVDTSDQAEIADAEYLAAFGFEGERATARELWRHLADAVWPAGSPARQAFHGPLSALLEHGTLSRRILAATGPTPDQGRLRAVYRRLADCLARGTPFLPA